MNTIQLGDRLVGAEHAPCIVAELSGNHGGSLDRAMAMVEAAAAAGAHAVKLQTYTADGMTLDLARGEFRINDPASLWAGETLHSLYEKAHTPWAWHEQLFRRCAELNLLCFSSPFDLEAVARLESLNTPCYKIASFENVDLELIRAVAATGKPVIMSTGMASREELREAMDTARSAGCEQIVLLKCTSAYPADPSESNLASIPVLAREFECQVGLSDHTLGLAAPLTAVALGATLIEKHFTLDRGDGDVDAAFSCEPAELASLVRESHRAWQAIGKVHFGPTESERASLQYRRSLYFVTDLRAGDRLQEDHLRSIRPGLGLAPKHLPELLGKILSRDVTRGTPVHWSCLR
ncbi:MAG: pseudaminic acid synthase [Planctomycetota bacterium]